jgi:hypothetical protein
MRAPCFNASWPLAELLLTDGALTVRGRPAVLRKVFGGFRGRSTVSIPWTELQTVDSFRSPIPVPGRFGLSFEGASGSWVMFFSLQNTRDALISALRHRGVSVTAEG